MSHADHSDRVYLWNHNLPNFSPAAAPEDSISQIQTHTHTYTRTHTVWEITGARERVGCVEREGGGGGVATDARSCWIIRAAASLDVVPTTDGESDSPRTASFHPTPPPPRKDSDMVSLSFFALSDRTLASACVRARDRAPITRVVGFRWSLWVLVRIPELSSVP